jgi:hypothetical protein
MPKIDYSYPIFGDNSSVGVERRKIIEEQAGISIKFSGKSRGFYNVKLIGTVANIAQAQKLLNEAVERSRLFHESTRTHRTKRREHFEAPMLSATPTRSSPKQIYKNSFEGLLDSDDEPVEDTTLTLKEPPKKLNKKERQARNKAAKGTHVDISKQVTGSIAKLKKHNWERKKALEEKQAELDAAAKKEFEERTWQTNPNFGELYAMVQLFDSQVDGKYIGEIYIGDSGMGYFVYHISGQEHQVKLNTIEQNDTYSGNWILPDDAKSGDTQKLFTKEHDVTITIIVEESGDDEVNSGNAWVILSETEITERFKKMKEFEVLDWAEEPLCA